MKESMFNENEPYGDMYCKGSTKEVKVIFRRFLEEISKFGEIKIKPSKSYLSFYVEHRLVGVECQQSRVKLHLTSEDAKYANKFDELRGSIYPQKGREEWTFIYIVNEQQVQSALEVIKKAYQNRKPSEINIGYPNKSILHKKTLEKIQLTKGDNTDPEKPSKWLKILEKKICECNKCDFNERTYARFCGGSGNDFRVMFISESPSTSAGTGKFLGYENFKATAADKLFSQVRKKFGLENCYTTDFVKCGIPNGKPSKYKVEQCVEYLKEEIAIIKPRVIVAVGKSFKLQDNKKPHSFTEILTKYLNFQKPILSTWHYSYVNRYLKNKPEKMKEYEEQHRKILQYL